MACWDLCFRYPPDLVMYTRICSIPRNDLPLLCSLYVLLQFNHFLTQSIISNFSGFAIQGIQPRMVRYDYNPASFGILTGTKSASISRSVLHSPHFMITHTADCFLAADQRRKRPLTLV